MAIPTALLAKVLGGIGVIATAATVISVTANKSKDKDTPKEPKSPTPEDPLKALNDKIKSLGITDCELVKNESSKTCDLNKEKIGKVKFDGKTEGASVSESASLNLKIEKGYEGLNFPEGLRFSFTNSSSSDVTIGDNPNQITFKSGITYDYKIKTSDNTTTLEKAWDLGSIKGIAGIEECTTTSGGNGITECSFRTGSINVWRNEGSNKFGLSTASSMPPSHSSTPTKIKVAKDSAGYRQGIKFYVEEEITLKISSGFTLQDYPLNKETSYEIDIRDIEEVLGNKQQIVKKWFLVDKSTAKLNEKIKDLEITGCDLGEGESSKTCTLDAEKIKAIKFDGKEGEDSSPDSSSLTLTIERDHLGTEFPRGLRFTFTNKNTENVTIGSSSSITLKPGVSYDFKIKDSTKLEKAWTLATLAAKVGLTCADDSATECDLKTTGINAWKDESHYITNAQISGENKKMEVAKDQKDYLEGFKFTVKGEGDIALTGGTKKTGNAGMEKLTKTGKAYGIDVKDIGGIKTWFLIEKSTTPA